jgi:hypothetical protein
MLDVPLGELFELTIRKLAVKEQANNEPFSSRL